MPIENVFELIRKAITNKSIKYYDDKIEEIKNLKAFMTQNKLFSIEKKQAWDRQSLDMENVFETAQFKELIKDFEQKITDCEEHRAVCYEIKAQFGKNQIVKKVDNFSDFLVFLNVINVDTNFAIDENILARIIGMAIYNNNRIYDKSSKELNKDLNNESELIRKETITVRALKPYFDSKGNIVANQDIFFFVDKLLDLFAPYFDTEQEQKVKDAIKYDPTILISLMKKQLLEANSRIVPQEVVEVTSKKQLRQNEIELAIYFDGENILMPCVSLEEFKKLVYSCYLSDEQSIRIISKMEKFMSKEDHKIAFLSVGEQEIFKLAQEKQIGNIQIKVIVDEINMFLEMYPSSSLEDKACIEEEIRTLITNLRYILNVNPAQLKLNQNKNVQL